MECLTVLFIFFSLSDAAITNTPQRMSVCNGEYVNLKWTFDTANFVAAEWKINGTLMLQYAPSQTPQLGYNNGYTSAKLTHITNGEINITSLTTGDSGNYSCRAIYSSGSPSTFETEMILTVYDMISTNLSCSYNQSVGNIDCSVIPPSITSLTINGVVHSTSSLPISGTGSATYTVCTTGDAAECRNEGIQPCISIEGQSEVTTEGSTEGTTTTTQSITTQKPKPSLCGKMGCVSLGVIIAVLCVAILIIILCCYMKKRNKNSRGGPNKHNKESDAEQTGNNTFR